MLNYAKVFFRNLFRKMPETGNEPHEYQTPPEFRTEIQFAESIGREIYLRDRAVVIAFEAAMAKDPYIFKKLAVNGYVVTGAQGEDSSLQGFIVHFYVDKSDVTVPLEVFVPFYSGKSNVVDEHTPPDIPSPSVRAMINARKKAMACVEPFRQANNSIVLSAAALGEPGYLVYLLAATSNPDVVVFGRHDRCLISEDGELSRVDSLACSVLEVNRPAKGHILAITCGTSEHPLETHVFTSLLVKFPLLVLCNENHKWQINEGRISYLGRLV